MPEQASQPERSPRRRKLRVIGGAILAATAATAAMMLPHGAKDTIDARPAPATSSPTPEASEGGEANEGVVAEFNKIKEPALASAKALLEKIPSNITNTDDQLVIRVNSATVGKYSPTISAEAMPQDHQITVEARDGEGGRGNALGYAFKVNDEGIFADGQVTSSEFVAALSDPAKVELTAVKVVDVDHNAELGVLHSGSGPTERYNATDAAIGEQNTYVFRTGEEVVQLNESLLPAMAAGTDYFTQQ